jgi:hypothetical protein
MKEILKKNKMLIALVVTIITTFFVTVAVVLHLDTKYRSEQMLKQYPFEVMKHEAVLSYYEYKSQLVKEVKAYIDSVAPTSALNGYAIVDCCEKYDLDIKFVLAQGQIESHFGTTGMATKTNSVFNVGAYDKTAYECINGKYKYLHPDNSIESYMQLLYSNYITGTKTELDLMAKFADKNGKKYSSNPNYEKGLFDLYNKIDKSTNITELQGEMRRYKIISGI